MSELIELMGDSDNDYSIELMGGADLDELDGEEVTIYNRDTGEYMGKSLLKKVGSGVAKATKATGKGVVKAAKVTAKVAAPVAKIALPVAAVAVPGAAVPVLAVTAGAKVAKAAAPKKSAPAKKPVKANLVVRAVSPVKSVAKTATRSVTKTATGLFKPKNIGTVAKKAATATVKAAKPVASSLLAKKAVGSTATVSPAASKVSSARSSSNIFSDTINKAKDAAQDIIDAARNEAASQIETDASKKDKAIKYGLVGLGIATVLGVGIMATRGSRR